MNKLNHFKIGGGRRYEAPTIEIISTAVEQGFATSSWGESGAAGGDFTIGGDYEF